MAAILENLHNVITLCDRSIQTKICYVGAESHASDDKKVQNLTGSRISYGVRLFSKAGVVVSQPWTEIEKQQI